MAKKKTAPAKAETTAVATTAITPVTASDLVTAGIVDFKLTKEDLIDLLVEEAGRTAQAEVDRLNAEYKEAMAAHSDACAAQKALWETLTSKNPAFIAAKKAYPVQTWRSGDAIYWSGSYLPTAVFHAKVGGPVLLYLTAKPEAFEEDPAAIAAAADIKRTTARKDALVEAVHEAEQTLERVKSSPRKIRVALVRQVLSNNEKGKFALENASRLAAGVLAAARESVQAERAAIQARCNPPHDTHFTVEPVSPNPG